MIPPRSIIGDRIRFHLFIFSSWKLVKTYPVPKLKRNFFEVGLYIGLETTMEVEEKNFKLEENMKKTRFGITAIGILVSVMLFLGITLAENGASLEGVVMDTKGVAVPGVEVIAKNTATQITFRTKTDKKGHYTFQNLPIGIYDVWVMTVSYTHLTLPTTPYV